MDALRETFDPDVDLAAAGGMRRSQGRYLGREAVMRWLEQLREACATTMRRS